MLRKGVLLLVFISSMFESVAQEIPAIIRYNPEDYHGETQSWMITQGDNNFIYAANNFGLLEFNGAEWTSYPTPNGSIMRAVKAIGRRIYSGCYMDFGYWEKDSYGRLKYESMVDLLDSPMVEDEQIWNIVPFEKWILFQSFQRIYMYDTLSKGFSFIQPGNNISKVAVLGGVVYFQIIDKGIYRIEEGRECLVFEADKINGETVVNFFSQGENILIHTKKGKFYLLDNGRVYPWNVPATMALEGAAVFSSIQLRDGSLMIGTISDGIFQLSGSGELMNHITHKGGLANNTILSLFEDKSENVWAGLDNGINCIGVKSPVRIFSDDKGEIGTVYCSVVHNGYLYLGTNQGLFYRPTDSDKDFIMIDGTNGQAWSLFKFDETLFCGHHAGTFIVSGSKVSLISGIPGTWGFRPVPGTTDTLLQGNYTGLYILHKSSGRWKFGNKIEGFNSSARYFEIDSLHRIWINHEYKGTYLLKCNERFDSVIYSTKIPNTASEKNSGLVMYKGSVFYFYKDGIFRYSDAKGYFVRDSIFSTLLDNDDYVSGKMIVDNKNRLWAFTRNNVSFFSAGQINNTPILSKIPIPNSSIRGMVGYENITPLDGEKYLIGTVNGYIILDINGIMTKPVSRISFNGVTVSSKNKESKSAPLNAPGMFTSKQNNFVFSFSVPQFDRFYVTEFQYNLEGFYDVWSEWQKGNNITFENLPFGKYKLSVRARVGDAITENMVTYNFEIQRPLFLSNLAIVVYGLLFLILAWVVNIMFRRYYSRIHQQEIDEANKRSERRNMEIEQEIMSLRNQQLKKDIENKNREVAISTMSIIRKNELLSSIKAELKRLDLEGKTKAVTRLIDTNINNTGDWEFFEEAFNNADQDFFKRIKEKHSSLTPNDLKLCAFLRLNLSSKEIAPLLNISVRSVEIKRYRLRQKLKLEHDEGLIGYILSI